MYAWYTSYAILNPIPPPSNATLTLALPFVTDSAAFSPPQAGYLHPQNFAHPRGTLCHT